MEPWLIVVCLSLAAYRLTRFAIKDDLFAGTRIKLQLWLQDKPGLVAAKLHYLTSCPYCTSFWMTLGLLGLSDQFAVIPLPWLSGAAAWGLSAVWWRVAEADSRVRLSGFVEHVERSKYAKPSPE